MDTACLEVLGAAYCDDPPSLARRWHDVDAQLREHIALENELLLPAYQHAEPEDAEELRVQHGTLRALLEQLGVDVQLHEVRAERFKQLVTLLRAHAAREGASLYPWAHRHLPAVVRRQLRARLSRWLPHRRCGFAAANASNA